MTHFKVGHTLVDKTANTRKKLVISWILSDQSEMKLEIAAAHEMKRQKKRN